MKYLKYLLTTLQYISFILLFAGASVFMLSHFGYINTVKPYVVQSGSMEPSIPTGSIILSLPSSLYQPGDVITFAADGDSKMLVTHRLNFKVHENGQTKYITSGDANEDFDRWEVRQEHIVGKVVATLPYAGYAIDFAKTPQGFIALVVIPATIVIYEELKNLLREFSKSFLVLKGFFRKRKEEQDTNTNSQKEFVFNKFLVLVPVAGVLVFITAFSAAYLFDIEKSSGNVIGVATSYTSTSPTVSPTISLSPTASPTPTPMVKLNEAAPATSPEWVEIYNTNPTADFLQTYYLDDDTDFIGDASSSAKILMSSLNITNSTYPTINVSTVFNNPGDTITIFDNAGNIIDTINYMSSPGTNSIGRETDGTGAWKFPCTNSTKGSSNNTQC